MRKSALLNAAFALLLLGGVATCFAQSVTVSPHMLVLNAQGQTESVQAEIRTSMPGGYSITGFYVGLYFNDVLVSEAYDLEYCYIDDVFKASFDRAALQANPDVQAMAGSVVIARVAGWYEADGEPGDPIHRDFSGTDQVEIVAPGKKK